MRETTAKGAVWYGYNIPFTYNMLVFMLKPLTRRILTLLAKRPEGIIVTDMYKLLKVEQSVCSQALHKCRKYELVRSRRDGKYKYYTVNKKRVKQIAKAVRKFAEHKKNRPRNVSR